MNEHVVGGITVDVCDEGCGGIWFDNFELDKVDESSEPADALLSLAAADPAPVMDTSARRQCPRCQDLIMMRHFVSVRREVEVDECPGCGGTFLDHGELEAIRGQFASEDARREAAREYFAHMFDDQLEAQAELTDAQVARARRFAGMLRLILPSSWLPGKQTWGAF
jgi:Zn-finger nucleic acid-binding protein